MVVYATEAVASWALALAFLLLPGKWESLWTYTTFDLAFSLKFSVSAHLCTSPHIHFFLSSGFFRLAALANLVRALFLTWSWVFVVRRHLKEVVGAPTVPSAYYLLVSHMHVSF